MLSKQPASDYEKERRRLSRPTGTVPSRKVESGRKCDVRVVAQRSESGPADIHPERTARYRPTAVTYLLRVLTSEQTLVPMIAAFLQLSRLAFYLNASNQGAELVACLDEGALRGGRDTKQQSWPTEFRRRVP